MPRKLLNETGVTFAEFLKEHDNKNLRKTRTVNYTTVEFDATDRVFMPNALIDRNIAPQLTLRASMLRDALLSKMFDYRSDDINDSKHLMLKNRYFTFYVDNLARLTGWAQHKMHAYAKECLEELATESYIFDAKSSTTFIKRYHYVRGEGLIELEISPEIIPYIVDIVDAKICSWPLSISVVFQRRNTKRCYEILKQQDPGKVETYTIEKFRHEMYLDGKYNHDFATFEKYLIMYISEINNLTDINVDYFATTKERSNQKKSRDTKISFSVSLEK